MKDNYIDWLNGESDAPIMSHTLFRERVANHIGGEKPTFMILIDNLRWDQWKMIRRWFRKCSRSMMKSFREHPPYRHQYSRNAMFAGLMPSEIEKLHPGKWLNDEDEGGKNMHEDAFLEEQLKRLNLGVKHSYNKI